MGIRGVAHRHGVRDRTDHARSSDRGKGKFSGASRAGEARSHQGLRGSLGVAARERREQAALLVLRSEGHSLAETAATLSLNPKSVGTLLARADAAFRKEYVHRYGKY
jgi:DNA-binding CsgD family transcriptional regulator